MRSMLYILKLAMMAIPIVWFATWMSHHRASLFDLEWRLARDPSITLNIDEDSLFGSTDCESYGTRIKLGPGSEVKARGINLLLDHLCVADERVALRNLYFNRIEGAKTLTLTSDRLRIAYDTGAEQGTLEFLGTPR